MADIQALTVTVLGNASITVPRFTVSCLLTDPKTGATLHDFTGANILTFPNVLATLTAAQRREILDLILVTMLHRAGGVA